MSYTGSYDGVRDSDDHFRQMESDFEALLGGNVEENEFIIDYNVGTKDDGTLRTFETGATRDTDENKLDWEGFISPAAMLLFAEYMHKHRTQTDGTIREADNWQKGMPRKQFMKSLIRHVWDLWLVWRIGSDVNLMDDLLCAILFNTQGLLHELAIGRDVSE